MYDHTLHQQAAFCKVFRPDWFRPSATYLARLATLLLAVAADTAYQPFGLLEHRALAVGVTR